SWLAQLGRVQSVRGSGGGENVAELPAKAAPAFGPADAGTLGAGGLNGGAPNVWAAAPGSAGSSGGVRSRGRHAAGSCGWVSSFGSEEESVIRSDLVCVEGAMIGVAANGAP